jgi:hypothetical protein
MTRLHEFKTKLETTICIKDLKFQAYTLEKKLPKQILRTISDLKLQHILPYEKGHSRY